MQWEYKVETITTSTIDESIEELLNKYGQQGFGLIQAIYSQTPYEWDVDHYITFIFERPKDG